ncbi:MAG: hypothetical protein QM743_02975 [Chitinophagaceae bacterium]
MKRHVTYVSVLRWTFPWIAMSGHSDEEEKRKSKEAGMNDYVTKPVDISRLFGIVDRLCNAPQNLPSARAGF